MNSAVGVLYLSFSFFFAMLHMTYMNVTVASAYTDYNDETRGIPTCGAMCDT